MATTLPRHSKGRAWTWSQRGVGGLRGVDWKEEGGSSGGAMVAEGAMSRMDSRDEGGAGDELDWLELSWWRR